MVDPPPPPDSEFSWSCSTGCFADLEMTQNISVMSLDITDGGVLNCVVNINGAELVSEPIELQVLMMGKETMFLVMHVFSKFGGCFKCTLRLC